MAFTMPKSRTTEDISSFCLAQLDDIFEQEILQPRYRSRTSIMPLQTLLRQPPPTRSSIGRGDGWELDVGASWVTCQRVSPYAALMCLPPAAQPEMTALRDVEELRSWSSAEAERTLERTPRKTLPISERKGLYSEDDMHR